MSLKAKRVKQTSNSGLTTPLLEPDNFPARVVQILDLGPRVNFFDKDKINHEIMLTYELTTEFMQDSDGNNDEEKPLWLSEVINMVDLPDNMTTKEVYADPYKSKAKLVQRFKAMDAKGVLDFDLAALSTAPCILTVIQRKKQDGSLKNDIGGVTGIMKGMAVAELVNPPKVFSLDEPDLTILGSLPDWLKEKITTNLEFKGSPLDIAINGKASSKPEVKEDVKDAKASTEATEEGDADAPW